MAFRQGGSMADRILPRYFGAQYDSMKQRQIYLHIQEIANKGQKIRPIDCNPSLKIIQLYKARLMIDMLLTGKIVLTDAQLLDGIFWFTLMQDDYERKEFIQFLRRFPPTECPIEIRLREPTIRESYKAFLVRGGVCCSYIESEMMKAVENAYLAGKSQLTMDNHSQTLDDWFTIMKPYLSGSEQSRFEQQKDFVDILDSDIPDHIIKTYDPSTYMTILQGVKQDHQLEWWLSKQNLEPATKELVELLERQYDPTDKTSPDRKVTLAKINELKELYPTNKKLIKQCDKLWNATSFLYNHTIARQYQCDAIDEGVLYVKKKLYSPNKVIDLNTGISANNIRFFSRLTWEQFYHLYNNVEIKAARELWFQNMLGNDTRISANLLEYYINLIIKNEVKPSVKDLAYYSTIAKHSLEIIAGTVLIAGGSCLTNYLTASQAVLLPVTALTSMILLVNVENSMNSRTSNLINVGLANIQNIRELSNHEEN